MQRITMIVGAVALLLGNAVNLKADHQWISAIVNLGDWSERLAGHSLAAIFGGELADRECVATQVPLPTELCGVSVLLHSDVAQDMQVLAPLLYVSREQINFQVPVSDWMGSSDPFPRRTAPSRAFVYILTLEHAHPTHTWSEISIEAQAPAIFEHSTPSGQAPVILHADGTLVTDENPANWDEFLTAYGTGFGLYPGDRTPWPTDFPADGYPAPLDRVVAVHQARILQVTGELDGVPAADPYVDADFVSLAPGFVGLNQVKFHLPCRLSQSPEPRILMQGVLNGRTKAYRIPMSEAAKAWWHGSCH